MFGRKRESDTGARRRPELRRQGPAQSSYSYYKSAPSRPTSEKTIDLGKSNRRIRLVPTIIALAVIVCSVLFSLTLTTRPGVSTYNDEPAIFRNLDDYALAAEEIMNQKLSSHTKLTVDTAAIEKALLERFPELQAAALRLPVLGRKPHLTVDLRNPTILLTTQTKSFVLDDTGKVVSEVQDLAEAARQGLPTVQDQSGLALEVGKQAVPSSTIDFIRAVTLQLTAQNLTVSQLTLPALANELDIRIEGVPYFVKTDVSSDVRLQIGSFLAVKSQLEGQHITPAEYIDVRVEEKVFYK